MGLHYVNEKVGREFVNTGLHYWTTGQDFFHNNRLYQLELYCTTLRCLSTKY